MDSINKNYGKYFYIAIDILWLLIAGFLIAWDFLRYFLLNKIPFNFLNMTDNLYHINDFSIFLAFSGFLIIIFKLFNLPIFYNINPDSSLKIKMTNVILGFILGIFLLIKVYLVFDYLFYQYQNYIAAYLLFSLIWLCFLNLKQDNIFKFLKEVLNIGLIISMFLLFSFEENNLNIFIIFNSILLLSFLFSSFILLNLAKRFNADSFLGFKKLSDNNKTDKFLIFLSTLNLGAVPISPMFFIVLGTFITIFSYDYDTLILNLAPFVLIFAVFIMSFNCFSVINKILINPIEEDGNC